ncbi:MAG: hypothetical protein JWO06_2492, partial [Bacteroidota bacterium]|nr:hypothetical protein [Bacteroidota bacterium]
GKKQLSSEAIQYYKNKLQDKSLAIKELNRITDFILASTGLSEFEQLLNEHENLIASQLKLQKVKDAMFPDYWGSVKSLGAWGGDFVLMTNEKSEEELKNYLSEKNISIVFSWKDLILKR